MKDQCALVQISDCHLFADKSKCGYNEVNPFRSLQLLLNQAKVYEADKIIVTGDISGDGSEQSYQHFLSLIDEAGLLDKLHTIPGNHDNAKQYLSLLGQYDLCSQGVLIQADWRIHGIDTMYQGTLGKITQNALTHLADAIEQSPNHNHLVCCHHHPITSGSWMDKHNWTNKHEFTQLVERYKAIKVVLYGHIHSATETQVEHCCYLSAPSSCWQWANSKDFGSTNECPGLRIIELHQDGHFQTSIHRLTKNSH